MPQPRGQEGHVQGTEKGGRAVAFTLLTVSYKKGYILICNPLHTGV